MESVYWKIIGSLFILFGLIYKELEVRKLKKRLKELEPATQSKRESFGICNECGGNLVEWVWNREGFRTARVVIACENQPKCNGGI